MATVAVHIDESGTHQGSPWCIVAGQIGSASDWQQFVQDWNAVLNRPEFGGVVFHATDLWAGKHDFSGWDISKRISLALMLGHIIENWQERIYSVAVAIPVQPFKDILAPILHSKIRDPYFPTLLLFLSRILTVVDKKFNASMVTCFADRKKEFEWRGQVLYDAIRTALQVNGQRLDEKLNYRSKELIVPLQAADFVANTAFKDLSVGGSGHPQIVVARGIINTMINGSFAERPWRIGDEILRAMATGDNTEVERLAALEAPE